MRWDNLRLAVVDGEAELTPKLFDQGAVVRTFDTPEFRGMTFYEIRAKSIINRVPEVSRVPFRWTINPYRGCSHSCTYCLHGDTPVLMADGTTRPIRDVRVGDRIYGTLREGGYRRYVTTEVLAHWSTVKPAYRVTLQDGTKLIASGDHRFLTGRGWKHVTGRMSGAGQRPYLTPNNELLGTGRFALPPDKDRDYRRGYLCGMIRGDAHFGSYPYVRRAGQPWTAYRFRLALIDLEALARTKRYLAEIGVATEGFVFQRAAGERMEMLAIRSQRAASFAPITQAIAWPVAPTDAWHKGFLAGIFDAEGGCSRGVMRISNTDAAILAQITSSLRRFGFSYAVEPRIERSKPLTSIYVRGGLRERLRFFHTVDSAITRKRVIPDGAALKSDAKLRVVSVEPLGVDVQMYDITTGTGDFIADGVVSHNCFARNTHTYLDMDAGMDFNSRIVVKVNAEQLLRKELASKKWTGEHIAMGTNVDCYQRAEGRYRLMPGILSALRDAANPFSILTKGSLILRDLPLLEDAARVTRVSANVSVGSVDREVWRAVEPGTPSPQKRLEVCRTLTDAGIGCGVLMAPILPFISDSPAQLRDTVKAIADAGASHVTPIVLHLRPGAREWFMAWLERDHPELVPKYQRLYGRGWYAPKAYQQQISSAVHELAERFRVGRAGAHEARGYGHPVARAKAEARMPSPEQLPLL